MSINELLDYITLQASKIPFQYGPLYERDDLINDVFVICHPHLGDPNIEARVKRVMNDRRISRYRNKRNPLTVEEFKWPVHEEYAIPPIHDLFIKATKERLYELNKRYNIFDTF